MTQKILLPLVVLLAGTLSSFAIKDLFDLIDDLDLDGVQEYLQEGGDPNPRNTRGKTAIDYLLENHHSQIEEDSRVWDIFQLLDDATSASTMDALNQVSTSNGTVNEAQRDFLLNQPPFRLSRTNED